MKEIFIKASYKEPFFIQKSILKSLPKKIGLISTIQFSDSLYYLKKQLKSESKKAVVIGPVLGCNGQKVKEFEKKVDCFLFIGSGKFYVLGFAIYLSKEMPIFIFNPISKEIDCFNWQEARKFKQKRKAQEIRFLSAEKIGILVSIKSEQQNLIKAMNLKENLEKNNKKAYLFLFDNLEKEQFENFPEIESWVNTACPGIFYDAEVYNY